MSTIEEKKAIIREFVDEALNKNNLGILDTIVAEDFIEEVPFPGQGPGREGLRVTLVAFQHGFSDMRWTVEEQIGEGDKVFTRMNFAGTHTGEFLGMPATGQSVSVTAQTIDVVRDGLMVRSRILFDTAAMLGQLGMMPG
jgi:steroid delta-isomerase-like uncharacterized protein